MQTRKGIEVEGKNLVKTEIKGHQGAQTRNKSVEPQEILFETDRFSFTYPNNWEAHELSTPTLNSSSVRISIPKDKNIGDVNLEIEIYDMHKNIDKVKEEFDIEVSTLELNVFKDDRKNMYFDCIRQLSWAGEQDSQDSRFICTSEKGYYELDVIEATYNYPDDKGKGDQVYNIRGTNNKDLVMHINYTAPIEQFENYLNVAEEIIDSLTIKI